MAKLYIGTSGWTYSSWKGKFYPNDLHSSGFLEFYAKHFNCTEVNYSFYHLPKQSTYLKWKQSVPDGFFFAVKASRFISHTKKLLDVEEPWSNFIANASVLAGNLGPILFQFPASFQLDNARLDKFLQHSRKENENLRMVFEFRHPSWFTKDTYALLSKHKVALCIADSPAYPRVEKITCDFCYFRFHGRASLFASKYTKQELTQEAAKMKSLLKSGLDVFAFFNNDARGHAVANAQTLQQLLDG